MVIQLIENGLQRSVQLNIRVKVNRLLQSESIEEELQNARLDCRAQLEDCVFEMKPIRVRYAEVLGENNLKGLNAGVKIPIDPIDQNHDAAKFGIPKPYGLHQDA